MGRFIASRPGSGNRPVWRGCAISGISAVAIAVPAAAHAAGGALVLDTSLIVDAMASTGTSTGKGERHRGATARLDVKLLLDGAPLGIAGLVGMADVAVHSGEGLSGSLGDLQGVSSIAATRMVRPVNAWLRYGSGPLAIKAGVIDTNADFDEQNIAAPFLNASHGMGPELATSGLNGGGAAPNSALGVVGFVADEASGLKLRAGVFTGRPGDPGHPRRLSWRFGEGTGSFSIAELDWTGARHRIALGAWRHSARLPRLDGNGGHAGSTGGFAIVEGTLAGRPADPESGEARGARLDGWLRLGIAGRAAAPVTRYLGGGLVMAGFWRRHPADTAGLALAHAVANPAARPDAAPETSVELTYQHALRSGLTLQPDVQWLLNPGGDRKRRDAVVFAFRVIAVR